MVEIRKTKTVKTGKHNTISIRSYRKYFKESLLESLMKKNLPHYSTFNCIDAAYTDLTTVKGKKETQKRSLIAISWRPLG